MILQLIVIGLALAGVWWFLRRPPLMRIVVRDGQIVECSPLPQARRREIEQIISGNAPETGRIVITGIRNKDGWMQLSFSGPIDAGLQQQLRNYFANS